MKQSMTAIAAIIATAGLAGAVQAQSMTPPGTSPSQTMQSTQYTGQNPSQPYGAQYNPYTAQQQQPAANPQWNASQQAPAAGTANWNEAQQRQATAPQTGMPPSAGGPVTRDTVREAQGQLREQGLYRGADDGVIGRGTRRAIAQFQRRNGLPATGRLDEQTLGQLGGGSPQGYGASAGQPIAPGQPMPQQPTAQGQPMGGAATAPNTGAYNPQPGQPMQR